MSLLRKRSATEHRYVEERLSAYLDNVLSSSEKTVVQRHLASCHQCRWSYETLRKTVQWTRELPSVPVPRMFTIPVAAQPARAPRPVPARRTRRSWGLPALQAATALLALLFFFVVAGDVWLTGFLPAAGPESEVALQAAPYAGPTAESAPEAPAAEPAPKAPPAEPALEAPAAEPVLEAPAIAAVEATVVVEVEREVVVTATAVGVSALPAPSAVVEAVEAAPVLEAEASQAGAEESPSAAMGTTAFPPSGVPAPSAEAAAAVDAGESRYPAPEAESLKVSEATASPEVGVGSGGEVPATEEAQASPVPAPTATPAVEPTLVSKAQDPEPAVPDRQEESWPRALRESVAPWLGTAEIVLGAAFLACGAITAVVTLRRLGRRNAGPRRRSGDGGPRR